MQNVQLGQFEDFDGVAFVPDGFQMPRDRENSNSTTDTGDEGYFATMGIPISHGRGFLTSDSADAPRVAVVNDQFAKHYWPSEDAVGKHIRLDSPSGTPVEIVGVAQTIKYQSTFEKPMDFVYMPLAQHPIARMDDILHAALRVAHLVGECRIQEMAAEAASRNQARVCVGRNGAN